MVMSQRHAEPLAEGRNFGRRVSFWVLGFTVIATTAVVPVAGRGAASSTAMRAIPDEPLTSYRALRRMHAKSEKFNQEGWLEAWTEFDGREFRFEIVDERGSEYVRNKVLKAVLKREQELVAEGPERAALTEQNYVFGETETEPDGERSVAITPKRKDVMLLEGKMVLTPDGSDVARVEGKLAKNPSFWTSLVNVIRHFARVDGVRVPVATESVAKVKFAGQSRLDVIYEYESINGQPVSVAAKRILASAAPR
jgi:hypothetical protein